MTILLTVMLLQIKIEVMCDLQLHSSQGYDNKYRDKTIADKLMYISNDDTQNYPISRLKLVEVTNQKSPQSC